MDKNPLFPEKKQAYNPVIRKMIEKASETLNQFKARFPKIYEHVSLFIRYVNSMRLGYDGAVRLYFILSACGWVTEDMWLRDLGRTSDQYWDLIDTGIRLAGSNRDERKKNIMAVYKLYCHMARRSMIDEAFYHEPHSPGHTLQTAHLLDLLLRSYTRRDDVFLIGFSKHANQILVILHFRNEVFRDIVLKTFNDWPNTWDRTGSSVEILYRIEEWFEGTTDAVTGWQDMNATMLDAAKRHILSRYEGRKREQYLRFVFQLFSDLVYAHPDYDFFKDSYIYSAQLVIDKRVPFHLANGYKVALYEQQEIFRQGRGVLFVLRNADRHGASNRRTEVYTYDLSTLEGTAWDAVANYILHHKRVNVIWARKFLVWMQRYNRKNGLLWGVITHELMENYRVQVSKWCSEGAVRNRYIAETKRFINWSSDKGFLTVKEGALKQFASFATDYQPAPEPMTPGDIITLRRTLMDMGKEEPRYYLTDIITELALTTPIRSGHIAVMSLSRISFDENGEGTLHAKEKNAGADPRDIPLTKNAVRLIKMAMELTKDIRKGCPLDDVRDQLFIYVNPKPVSIRIGSYTIGRFNNDLENACKRAGIDKVTSGRLRDTYMSAVNLLIAKKVISEQSHTTLTRHARKTSINSYAMVRLTDVVEAAEGITIGKLLTA